VYLPSAFLRSKAEFVTSESEVRSHGNRRISAYVRVVVLGVLSRPVSFGLKTLPLRMHICVWVGWHLPRSATIAYGDGGDTAGAFTVDATLDTASNWGGFDYTTFSIAAGVTVTVTGCNPLIIRASTSVTITGTSS